MGLFNLLNAYFDSTEALAKKVRQDRGRVAELWKEYLATIPEKEKLISGMAVGPALPQTAEALARLMKADLSEIGREERTEKQLIIELERLEDEREMDKVRRFEYFLKEEETRHIYVHRLLLRLYTVLRYELQLASRLTGEASQPGTLILNLKRQFEIEKEIIRRAGMVGTFQDHFAELMTGIRVIRRLDAKENRMVGHLRQRMNRILITDELTQGVTFQWVDSVFKGVEFEVAALVAKGATEYHKDVDFEFVNSPRFVELARERIQMLRPHQISEHALAAFVHIFREWFNER